MKFNVMIRCGEFCEDYESGDRIVENGKELIDPVEAIKLSASMRDRNHMSWIDIAEW